jgi:hypothetical protein
MACHPALGDGWLPQWQRIRLAPPAVVTRPRTSISPGKTVLRHGSKTIATPNRATKTKRAHRRFVRLLINYCQDNGEDPGSKKAWATSW